jgi:hypothetical protein
MLSRIEILEEQIVNLSQRVCRCRESSRESSSEGDEEEGLVGMDIGVSDDDEDIPILEEARESIAIPLRGIGNVGNTSLTILVSRQRCIRSLGRISSETLPLAVVGTQDRRDLSG